MVVARTSYGAVRGERSGTVVVFRGVPYADAPVGVRRWREPSTPPPWTGTRDATTFGPVAPQDISAERLAKWGLTMSEDCLHLNLWTPAADEARRPVLVFLHGGGVVAGTASAPLLDGASLAARGDLVVVTVEFRLGGLGSLNSHDQHGIPTNLAFRDQLEALRWVRSEIGSFGGDPGNVTVAGQSSGAVTIGCMLAADAAEGLFDRAILQSGGLERVRTPEAALAVARQFFAALRAPEPFDLQQPTIVDVLAAQATIPTGFVPPEGPFHHAVDGDLIVEHPLVAAASRPLHPVPVLAGTTRDEWRAFDAVLDDDAITEEFLWDRARALVSNAAEVDELLERYRSRPPAGGVVEQRRAVASAMVTDFHFAAPTDQLTRDHAAHGNPVFRFELGWPSARPDLGACHDTCLPLVFGTMERAPGLVGTGPDVERMSEAVQDAWIAFVRDGDPSTPALGEWPSVSSDRRPTMLLDRDPGVVEDHRRSELDLWNGRYPANP